MRTAVDAQELLANTRWVRRLAGHLARDPDTADELAQETWLAAADSEVPASVGLPTWLAGILRNLARMRARSDGRRQARERMVGAGPATATTPEQALERAQLDHLLGQLVLGLAEPYRTTVVLRYHEGLSASEIARRTGVSAGTVRWRLKQGLDTIRAQLDEKWGRRDVWVPLLLPLGTRAPRGQSALAVGAVGLALVAGAMVLWLERPPAERRAEVNAPAADPQPPAPVPPPRRIAAGTVDNPNRVPRVKVPLGGAPIAGPATARVTILHLGEYESFFCARLNQALESVRLAHPEDVRVQMVQATLPLHENALPAARAAYAAGEQGKYWEMHRLLFANPDQTVSDPRVDDLLSANRGRPFVDSQGVMRRPDLGRADLESYASQLGLDLARFRADLDGPAVEHKMALDEATVASAGEITAIPVMFINGRRVNGSRSPQALEALVVEELRAANALLASGVSPEALYNELPGQTVAPRAAMPVPAAAARVASAASDDFESGGLGGWRTESAGAGGWFVYSSGKTPPDPAVTDRKVPFDVPDPPGGSHAAITDMNGPGTRILYRDVTLDGRYRLHLTVYYTSGGPLTRPIADTLDYRAFPDNLQFRVDLIALSAPLDSLARADLLAPIFKARLGGRRQGPTPITFDLSPFQGQTVRLRLAVTDNRAPVRAGVDDVRFEKLAE